MAPSLSEDSAIQQLRQLAVKRLPSHLATDQELKKWLITHNFHQERAEAMLKQHLDWRQEYDIDNIFNWNAPEVIKKYYSMGFSGLDKEGVPVGIIPFGNLDVRGLIHSCPPRDYVLYSFLTLESAIDQMRKKYGTEKPYQMTAIFDIENFSLLQITWKPALDLLIPLIQMYEANYPVFLRKCYFVNAPRIFSVAFAIFKPILHSRTLDNIHIYGKTGWQEAILEEIPRDQLPVHYNGTQTDPDGDPKCSSKICYGGEVPKSYYTKKKKLSDNENQTSLKKLIVASRSKRHIDLEVTVPGTEIRWEFQTNEFDIGFGIIRLLSDDEEYTILPIHRVKTQFAPQEGKLVCSEPGIYRMVFDNEYSFMRAKTLLYRIDLFPPANDTLDEKEF